MTIPAPDSPAAAPTPAGPGRSDAEADAQRTVRVARNAVSNYVGFFGNGVVSFLLTPLMVHVLGDGGYGLWVTVFSLTGYFGLVDQGLRPSLVRYVSKERAANDHDALSRTLTSALLLYSCAGLVVMAGTWVVAKGFGAWVHLPPEQIPVARQALLLAGASLALGFPFGVFGAALSGLQRYDVANGIGMVVLLLRAVAFVVALRLGAGLVELAWIALITTLLGHVLTMIAVRRLIPEARFSLRAIDRAHLRRIGSYSSYAFIGAVAARLAFKTDALVITAFLGTALVTPFALAAGLVDNARTLVYSATWVLSPTASELETLGEKGKLHAMLINGAKYSVLICWPVLFALMVFGDILLLAWMKHPYPAAARVLIILSIPTLVALPQSAASSVLFGVSRHRGVVLLSLVNSVVNLGLSILWARALGLDGVALGTAVPLLLLGGVATALYAARALDMPLGRYAWQGFAHPGLLCLAFLAPALAVRALWHPVGWGPLIAAVAGSWLIFAAFTWRFGFSALERQRWEHTIPRVFGIKRGAARVNGAQVVNAAGPLSVTRASGAEGFAVSVVIPTHNNHPLILGAIESVLGQTLPPAEVVVVDDRSSDETARALAERYVDHPVVRVVSGSFGGAAAARNAGWRAARFPWVGFLDADDVWFPEMLSTARASLETFPTAEWFFSDGTFQPLEGREWHSWFERYIELDGPYVGRPLAELIEVNFVMCSAVVVRRELLEAVGGFDTALSHAEDLDLWIRLAKRAPAVGADRPLVRYQLQSSGLTRQTERRLMGDVTLFRRLAQDPELPPALRRRARRRAAMAYYKLAFQSLRQGDRRGVWSRLRAAWMFPDRVLPVVAMAAASLLPNAWLRGLGARPATQAVADRSLALTRVKLRSDPALLAAARRRSR